MSKENIFHTIRKESLKNLLQGNIANIICKINKEPGFKVTDDVGNTLLYAVFKNKELNQIQIIYILKILLDRGLDIDAKNGFEKTILHLAIERRYRDIIDFCIQRNVDLNVTNSKGNTIAHFIIEEECRKFHLIARNENLVDLEDESLNFVNWMWFKGIDFVNSRNKKNQSAIYLAIELNLQHILLTLLNSILNFSAVEKKKKRPLLCAFLERNGNSEEYIKHKTLSPINSFYYKHRHIYNIVKVLLEKNMSMSNKTLNAALLIAIKSEQPLGILELILQRVIYIVSIDRESLIKAFTSIYGNREIINWSMEERMKILLKLVYKGADINERDDLRKTIASKWFIHHPRLEMVELLKECRTDFNVPVDDGTFLHLISRLGNELGMVELAMNEKCDLNIRDSIGAAPLHNAIFNKNNLVASDLIEHGAQVNVVDIVGKTPLYFACETGQAGIVEKLIEYNADLECRDFYNNSLLHIAANNAEIVNLLVKNGADVDSKNNKGQTPLHRAENLKVIEILLNAGALVDARNNEGHTPLSCLLPLKSSAKVVELLKFGADIQDPTVLQSVLHRFQFYDSNIRDALQYLVEHLIKLTAAGILKNISGLYEESEKRFGVLFKNCQREIESLKTFMVDNSTSLYKLLHKNPNRRCAYVNNEKLRNIVENSGILQASFPNYFVIIMSCYNEAKTRKPLLEKACCILKKMVNVTLPDLCVDHILVQLNNSDLWNFNQAGDKC